MTLDVTIRQKLVRVLSSAAVCGLSISFIVDEAVDQKAHAISEWSVDANLIPVAYLPTRPLQLSFEKVSREKIETALVAANSFDVAPAEVPPPIFQDSLRNILAAPADVPAPVGKLVRSAKASFVEKANLEPELASKEVEKILSSIHAATNALSGSAAQKQTAVAAGSIVVKSLPDAGSTGAVTEEVSLPTGTVASNKDSESRTLAAVGDEVIFGGGTSMAIASEATAPNLDSKEWNIRGRITAGFTLLEPGHFEVSLFSKIDQDGVPVGFPLAHKILPAGISDFVLRVPAKIEGGYLYGEFVVTQTGKRTWIAPPVNPWARNDRQFAELTLKREDTISSVAAAPSLITKANDKNVWKIRGNVTTLFAKDGTSIPQEDVVIKVRGRKESTRTDKFGAFDLEIPHLKGSVFLEFLKAGYHPVLVSVPAGQENQALRVELASRDAIEQVARRMGTRQLSAKGVFMGRALSGDGVAIKGLSLELSTKAEGPFYFDERGFPSAELKSTSSDGRFLFLNVESGTGFVDATLNGEAIAPFLLSTVEGGEMVTKSLTPEVGSIKGRLFNPVSAQGKLLPVAGARIRVEGASDWSNTDSYGAFSVGPMKWMKGEKISLEFSAERYNNHRYLLTPEAKASSLNLYAFPAMYLGRLAASMDVDLDQYSGIVLGKVSQLSVRIDALADHSVVNSAKDFYFDTKGKLRGSHTMTDPKFGTYVIFNVPKGRTLLQGNDSSGTLRYSEAIVSSPASISVIMD